MHGIIVIGEDVHDIIVLARLGRLAFLGREEMQVHLV